MDLPDLNLMSETNVGNELVNNYSKVEDFKLIKHEVKSLNTESQLEQKCSPNKPNNQLFPIFNYKCSKKINKFRQNSPGSKQTIIKKTQKPFISSIKSLPEIPGSLLFY